MKLSEIFVVLKEALELSKTHFVNAENRIYFLYLLSSLALAFFIYKKNKSKKGFWSFIFDKRIWSSKSAILDYLLFIFNNLFKVAFIGPYLIMSLYVAFYFNEQLVLWFGFPKSSLTLNQTIILYTISLTIFNDLLSYLLHFLMHKVPLLWEFHKVHHSATTLNPLTQYRVHPVELIINNLRGIIGFGLVTGFFDYLSNHQADKIVFIGANIFTFLFMFFGANLRHSHVKLKYPSILEYIFISPYQHQIHHSSNDKHFDKNMGSKFAIWDYLFGTLILSKETSKLRFGLGREKNDYNSFVKLLLLPFKKSFQQILFVRETKTKNASSGKKLQY